VEGDVHPVDLARICVAIAIALGLAGCGMPIVKPSAEHISAESPAPKSSVIPPPVQLAPILPKPTPAIPAETYSVVVSGVRVQDLLFALARDAKVNVDIGSDVTGTVTMNAVDQTLPQLLERIADQVDIRYQFKGADLMVRRDKPYLHIYHIDYVNLTRDAKSQTNLSTQLIASAVPGASGGTSASPASNSTTTLESVTNNEFWRTLVDNVKGILQQTAAAPDQGQAAQAPAAQGGAAATPGAKSSQSQPGAPESTAVIANPESGVLFVRATSRQQARVQQFLDQVLVNARREVLIEATVAEVDLNNNYQRGIDWAKLRTGGTGFQIVQSSANTPAAVTTNAFTVGYALASSNFTSAIKLLESFGTVHVLSSPTISVLNNQTALLKVVDNLVYFTVQSNTTSAPNSTTQVTFTTTMQTVPVGFIMSVVPQISSADAILLNLRPTISRQIGTVTDPNPSLANPCGTGVSVCTIPPIKNNIPVIQTREMESILRMQSGQIAVLGGLMQDTLQDTQDLVPGLSNVPVVGPLFNQRNETNTKTELVIFLRATVIRNPSTDADFASFRRLLPGPDYLSQPNPAMSQLPGPNYKQPDPTMTQGAPETGVSGSPSR
jgi:MSHA biogenesis protein MshL